LLGTGGNDGRLDFSTNFHQRLLEILDPSEKTQQRSRARAADLLFGTQTAAMTAAAVGQFDPNAAGGPGSSRFGAADSLVNPWGYVLMVEGALMFAAGAVRRYQHDVRRAAIPFTVRELPEGSASGAAGEVSRGEVWVPVWSDEFSMPEIRQLFGEARAAWRGRPARRPSSSMRLHCGSGNETPEVWPNGPVSDLRGRLHRSTRGRSA
jgi:CRISPR-associated protein Csx17